ncbi:hypothetical protein [Clostridium paraputrificum]
MRSEKFVITTPPSEELIIGYYQLLAKQLVDRYGKENVKRIVEIAEHQDK